MWEYLYHPARFLERTYKFCLAVRPTRKAIAARGNTKAQEKLADTLPPSLKEQYHSFLVFFHHVWTHGIIAPHRRQYWKQLYGMRKHNPSRLKKYLIHCVSGEPYLQIAKTIRQDISQLLAEQNKTDLEKPKEYFFSPAD